MLADPDTPVRPIGTDRLAVPQGSSQRPVIEAL